MKPLIFIPLFALTLFSCKENQENPIEIVTSEPSVISNILNTDNIETQRFIISGNADTTIVGKNGTKVSIEQKSFETSSGYIIEGPIKVELKECLDQKTIVLAGLATMSNGKILESDGMINLEAYFKGEAVQIRSNSSIKVEIPTNSEIAGMKFYQGIEENGSINWTNPEPLVKENSEQDIEENRDSILVDYISDTIYKSHNISYNFLLNGELVLGEKMPKKVVKKLHDLISSGNGLKITKDSTIVIDGQTINLYFKEELETWKDYQYEQKWVSTSSVNTFKEDKNNSYIFNMKKLGWANIDRLYDDPRTKEVDWLASINNHTIYSEIFVSLIFDSKKIYLPGYVREDGTFSFTHGDYEKTALPVGERVTIVVTAYKNSIPFYSIEKITIQNTQSISLELAETSQQKLSESLSNEL